MKREELIRFYNFLCKDVIAIGCKYPKMAEHKVDEYLSTLPDAIDYKQEYEEIVNSDWFKKAYENRPIGDVITLPDEKEEILKNFEEKISQQEDITPDWKDDINKVIDEMIDEMPKTNQP